MQTIETAMLRLYADVGPLLKANDCHVIEAGGLILRLSIEYPATAKPAPESQCEQDCFDAAGEIIAETGQRATSRAIIDRLNETGRLWGRSTMLNALASLTHKGLLVNPGDKRGYGLPLSTNELSGRQGST